MMFQSISAIIYQAPREHGQVSNIAKHPFNLTMLFCSPDIVAYHENKYQISRVILTI